MAQIVALIAPLVLLLAPTAVRAEVPACVSSFISGEESIEPAAPAPSIAPDRGPAGTSVVVTGRGATPGAVVTVIGLYGEADCAIAGVGDQLLGSATASTSGRFTLSVSWPATFTPLLGRDDIGEVPLPAGPYYIIAFECSDDGSCGRAPASAAGGPFVLGDVAMDAAPAAATDGGRAPALAIAGVAVLTIGTMALRRLVRARRAI